MLLLIGWVGSVGVGLKSVQALLKVPIIKMLQREVGGGKQFRGVQPPLCTATAVFTTAQYENSGNIHFTKGKMKKVTEVAMMILMTPCKYQNYKWLQFLKTLAVYEIFQ